MIVHPEPDDVECEPPEIIIISLPAQPQQQHPIPAPLLNGMFFDYFAAPQLPASSLKPTYDFVFKLNDDVIVNVPGRY